MKDYVNHRHTSDELSDAQLDQVSGGFIGGLFGAIQETLGQAAEDAEKENERANYELQKAASEATQSDRAQKKAKQATGWIGKFF